MGRRGIVCSLFHAPSARNDFGSFMRTPVFACAQKEPGLRSLSSCMLCAVKENASADPGLDAAEGGGVQPPLLTIKENCQVSWNKGTNRRSTIPSDGRRGGQGTQHPPSAVPMNDASAAEPRFWRIPVPFLNDQSVILKPTRTQLLKQTKLWKKELKGFPTEYGSPLGKMFTD